MDKKIKKNLLQSCILAAALALLISACQNPFSKDSAASVTLHTGLPQNRSAGAPSNTALLELTVEFPGEEAKAPLVRSFRPDTGTAVISLPAGPNRTFTLRALSREIAGITQVLYAGDPVTADLEAGKTVSLTFNMSPLPDTFVPYLPAGSSLTLSSITDTSLDITWPEAADHVTSAASLTYTVYRSASNNITTPADCTANGTELTTLTGASAYTAAGLTAETTYYFNVVVADEAGNTAAYTMSSAATASPPDTTNPVPGSSGTLSTANITDTSLDLSWTNATDNVTAPSSLTYTVYRSVSNNITTPADCSTNGTELTTLTGASAYTAAGLTAETTYYFNVVVADEAGNTAAYTMGSATTEPAPLVLPQTDPYGYYLAGDGSGGGGGGDYTTNYSQNATGGAGGGDADTLTGTPGNDVIFGDGSGGGGGAVPYDTGTAIGGTAGAGSDTLNGGAGNDIIFGDGFDGETVGGGDSAAYTESQTGGGNPHGGDGGFGGGGGGGGAYYSPNGDGGTGGLLAGGGGSHSSATTGVGLSLYGGFSGGLDSKPAGGSSTDDTRWGGKSAIPAAISGCFQEQSLGGTAWNAFGAGGGAGFGGGNTGTRSIDSGVSEPCNGGNPQGGAGRAGQSLPVAYYDSDGGLYTYVQGELANIFTSTAGTLSGVGTGHDTLNGGPGSDDLFGLDGNDTFVFELNDAGSSDTDTVWDFNRLSDTDKLKLTIGGSVISTSTRDALIAGQTASGDDRTIIFTDSATHTVTIIIKNLGRDLAAADFF